VREKRRRPAPTPRWSARGRRSPKTQGASQGVGRAALRHAPPVHRAPERYLGAPPPLIPGKREAKSKTRAQKRAAGTRKSV